MAPALNTIWLPSTVNRSPPLSASTPTARLPSNEIRELDLKVEDGKVVAYRAKVNLSFKYESGSA